MASQSSWQITARLTDDASGSTLDRPGLRKALLAVQAGRYDMLLVYRLDRLTRIGTRAIANQHRIRTRLGKLWSGVTVANMLSNRVYVGDKIFGDVTVDDAHHAIITSELFAEVQQVVAACGEAASRRRAANSDYDLTGHIPCADCGLKYIGTSA